MICPRLHCKGKALIHKTYGVMPCTKCQKKDARIAQDIAHNKNPEFYNLSKHDRFTRQRDTNAKDILQPWDGTKPSHDFVKAYPNLAENYFSKDELKRL
jgi:hypothetical protein